MMLFHFGTACAHCEWSKVPFAAQDLSSCDNLNSFWQLHNVKWAGAKLIVAPPVPTPEWECQRWQMVKGFCKWLKCTHWEQLLGAKTTLRTHYGEEAMENHSLWYMLPMQTQTGRHKHTHTHRERDTNNTQTCGEHLKGLNKLFISGVGFWRRQNAMAGGRETKRERGDRVGKRGNSQANICEKPRTHRAGLALEMCLMPLYEWLSLSASATLRAAAFTRPHLLPYSMLFSLSLSLSVSLTRAVCLSD